MTRKEQIVEYLKDRNIPINSLEANSIIEGIIWADEHPKSDVVNTQEFIEKACKIYRRSLIKFNPSLQEFPSALDEAVYIFKKQLNE